MADMISAIALQLEAQSLNSIVGGFAFASALAWMSFVKIVVASIVRVSADGLKGTALTALFTTLLAIIVYMAIKALATNVKINDPQQPVYAVTAAR
jgi:hypothetical protein